MRPEANESAFDLDDFAASLKSLVPVSEGLTQEAILFEAGRANALRELNQQRRTQVWKTSAASSLVTALAVCGLWLVVPMMLDSSKNSSPDFVAADDTTTNESMPLNDSQDNSQKQLATEQQRPEGSDSNNAPDESDAAMLAMQSTFNNAYLRSKPGRAGVIADVQWRIRHDLPLTETAIDRNTNRSIPEGARSTQQLSVRSLLNEL